MRFPYPSSFSRPGLEGPGRHGRPSAAGDGRQASASAVRLRGRHGNERPGPADVRYALPDSFEAPRAPEALRGVSLRIEAGETVALVGETGAGKSTVMKLLARFYDPDEGCVRVDGHDLRTLELAGLPPPARLRPPGGVPVLRDHPRQHRLRPSRRHRRGVEAAARAVGAHEFIAELPGGYLHELTERGRSLSAGQRQLIALARAELVDPAILLLDEATSNLDLATEARVAAAMQRVSHGPHDDRHRPPPADGANGRPHRRARRRPRRRDGHP